jgi:sorbitol/mannitol transport system substrate-binding protein
MRGTRGLWSAAAVLAVAGVVATGCGGDDGGGGGGTPASKGGEINVAIVDNPQMKDIAKLTPSLFTSKSGIKVNYTVLDEGTLRQVTTRDVAAGGRQFDVAMIGMFEAPQFGQNGTLVDLTPQASEDPQYKLDDVIPSVRNGLSYDGKLYAAPFYAESSFLMYRKDVLKDAGVEMPAKPTWQQVADIARKINKPDMAGICLRGKPGWGDLGASFTTVLNTFGGTWWSAKPDGSVDKAMVDQPQFKEALEFYVGLVNDAGEKDAANASFNECLSQYKDGKVAMWYDATVAAGLLEADDSPVKGKNGYAAAPVDETAASGWLWSWALAIPKTTEKQDLAWKYISFATGPEYLKEAGPKLEGGWAALPPGTRKSTYEIPQYKKAAKAFAEPTLEAMAEAPIDNPGTTKRPGVPGVQYVGIPEFQDVGNQCTQQFSAVIAKRTSIDAALKSCQDIASQVGGG